MKTMFVSHENNNGNKKKFQKPNILRRKTKGPITKPKITESYESPGGESLVNSFAPKSHDSSLDKIPKVKYSKPLLSKKPVQRVKLDNYIRDEDITSNFFLVDSSDDMKSSLALPESGNMVFSNNNEEEEIVSQTSVNIESFLNDGASTQNTIQYDMDNVIDSQTKQQWCLDLLNGTQQIIIEDFDGSQIGSACMEQNPSVTNMVSLSEITTHHQENSSLASNSTETPSQDFTIEYLASCTMNFKCDEPNCNKKFRSEQKLMKHKSVHNPESSTKVTRQTNSECPVKRVYQDGKEEPCGRMFTTREELVKHLNEDHSPEDALFICTECGRRFFWASGLRAHARAHCGRPAALACAWPGCGRVFRQPCRLREHTRAHTGDKPYPCRYPNCGWSFRTASKLLRHARRHTGERRHACAACGRAFLRREHLRDHHARHLLDKHPCTHTGCPRTYASPEALLAHMNKVHKDKDNVNSLTTAIPATSLPASGLEETYTISLDSSAIDAVVTEVGADAHVSDAGGVAAGGWAEGRAARTHCTWPLQPRAGTVPAGVDSGQFVLEEDVQVELSEGSESNIYTIRSDLFLHGNVLNNEDSGHMVGVEGEEAAGGGALLVVPHTADTDLGLLDAHPTIDLMQEELMYTDAAVDESSFRVFLLSGEELG